VVTLINMAMLVTGTDIAYTATMKMLLLFIDV